MSQRTMTVSEMLIELFDRDIIQHICDLYEYIPDITLVVDGLPTSDNLKLQIKVWVLRVDARCTDPKCRWHVNRMGNVVKEVNDRATEHACTTGHAVKVQAKVEKEIIPRKGESDETLTSPKIAR